MYASTQSDDPLQVVLEVANHDALTRLFGAIESAEVEVTTENISTAAFSPETRVTLDLDVLTEKQRDTVELALDNGYYDRPRETDLADLAGTLGISRSAVSQRIRAAEITLIKHAFQRCD